MRANSSGPIVWTCVVAATCVLLFLFQKILWLVVPFMLATILYCLLLPIVQRLTFLGLGFRQSILLVITMLFLLCGALATFAVFYIVPESSRMQQNIGNYFESGTRLIYKTLGRLENSFPFLKEAGLTTEVMNWFSTWTSHFAKDYLGGLLLEIAQWLPSLLLVPYITYFMLDDAAKFKKFIVRTVPNAFFEKTLLLIFRVGEQVRRYFQGLMLLTLLDATCLSLGLWALGFSSPIFLGVVTSVFSWIPYVGSIVGCLIVLLVAAAEFANTSWVAYGAVGVFIIVRLLDDFVFMPLTIGRSLQVHPLVTVLMIFVGGAVAGVSGLLFVMPVLGIVMVVGEIIGEVTTDERLQARHALAKALHRARAQEHLR